jgi:hypothetical protein
MGFQRRDDVRGTILYPAEQGDRYEDILQEAHQGFMAAFSGAIAQRYHIRMPYCQGDELPQFDDYALVSNPQRLATTSVSVLLVPNRPNVASGLRFDFVGKHLPTLRERLRDNNSHGLVGNLGYYVTAALVDKLQWAHNRRFPAFRLEDNPSYIGFHMNRDRNAEQVSGSFQGAHPAVVGVTNDGRVRVVSDLQISAYDVVIHGPNCVRFPVRHVNEVNPAEGVAVYTPAFRRTKGIASLIERAERTGGQDESWKTCSTMIPSVHGVDRVHLFVTNTGRDGIPEERVAALWQGVAPLPSFGAVLAFTQTHFEKLFGNTAQFWPLFGQARVQVVPTQASHDLEGFDRMLGGLVPAVADGVHMLGQATQIPQVMSTLSSYGATSPVAQCGRETRNFDPRVREPAGLLVQIAPGSGNDWDGYVGWVLFDGRHELSVGASVVDAAKILGKLEESGALGGMVEQAVFVDGGSAMKAYHIHRAGKGLQLDLLNRVAAGSRNGPGSDADGLNLYSVLHLR